MRIVYYGLLFHHISKAFFFQEIQRSSSFPIELKVKFKKNIKRFAKKIEEESLGFDLKIKDEEEKRKWLRKV